LFVDFIVSKSIDRPPTKSRINPVVRFQKSKVSIFIWMSSLEIGRNV